MPSSPAEPVLRAIIAEYDRAIEFLKADDFAAIERILGGVERRLGTLPPASGQPEEATLRCQAAQSHERLLAALHSAHEALVPHLRQVREGRRALRGYRALRELGPPQQFD